MGTELLRNIDGRNARATAISVRILVGLTARSGKSAAVRRSGSAADVKSTP